MPPPSPRQAHAWERAAGAATCPALWGHALLCVSLFLPGFLWLSLCLFSLFVCLFFSLCILIALTFYFPYFLRPLLFKQLH